MFSPLSSTQINTIKDLNIPLDGHVLYPRELPTFERIRHLSSGLFADTKQELGRGVDKTVYLSYLISQDGSCSPVARAVFDQVNRRDRAVIRANNEFDMLEYVKKSPFVIHCLAKTEESVGRSTRPVLYFPYYANDLATRLKGTIPLEEDEVKMINHSLFKALRHIEDVEVLHRDIKPANVLLSTKENIPCGRIEKVVLADFGSAIRLGDLKSKKIELMTEKCRNDLESTEKVLRDLENHLVVQRQLRQTTLEEYDVKLQPRKSRPARGIKRTRAESPNPVKSEGQKKVKIIDPAKNDPSMSKPKRGAANTAKKIVRKVPENLVENQTSPCIRRSVRVLRTN